MTIKFGEYIKQYLEVSNMKQVELANEMNVSEKHLSQLINGKCALTIEMADKLSKAFKTSIDLWISLDVGARNELQIEKNGGKKYLDNFGLLTLTEKNIINNTWTINTMYKSMLEWFGVTNLDDYRKRIKSNPLANFKKFQDKPAAYVWIRECEIMEKQQTVPTGVFRANNYDEIFKKLLKIFRGDISFQMKMDETSKLLLKHGINIIYNPFIKDSTIQGFSITKSKKRYIYISDMNKREYFIFFSILHELTHIFKNDIPEENVDSFVVKKYTSLKESGYEVKSISDAIVAFEKKGSAPESKNIWDSLRDKYPSVSFVK